MKKFKNPRSHDSSEKQLLEMLADIRELLYIEAAADSGFQHDQMVEEFKERRMLYVTAEEETDKVQG